MSQNSPKAIRGRRYLAALTLSSGLVLCPALVQPSIDPSGLGLGAHALEASPQVEVTSPEGATVKGPDSIKFGQTIEVTGSGWLHPEGGGSTITLKADKRGLTRGGSDILKTFTAEDDGSFKLTLDYPSLANGFDQEWEPGSEHIFHFLTGSGKAGDAMRALVLPVTIEGEPDSPAPAPDTSQWTKLSAGQASLFIKPYQSGEKIRVRGQGWVKGQGQGGSVVALKLASGQDTFYERADNSAQNAYLRTLGQAELGEDRTIWALLTDDASVANPQEGIYLISSDGSFDLELEVPEPLRQAQAGQYLAVQTLSGRFAPGDTRRSARSEPVPVNGLASQEGKKDDQVTCQTEQASPSARLAQKTVQAGGSLHLLGQGWCNPQGKGAPRIAVKIDDAAISHRDTAVHSNKTIWAIIEPDPKTGEIDTWIQLPAADGSDSEPGLSEGAHSLRLLAGSLQAGDMRVSYGGTGTLDFIVGKYAPTRMPDVLSEEEITSSPRNEVMVKRDDLKISVTVPQAEPGQWVRVNPYLGGSIRARWGSTWQQLDQDRSIHYSMPESLAAGDYKFVVQSGDQESFGKLMGWASLKVAQESQDTGKSATWSKVLAGGNAVQATGLSRASVGTQLGVTSQAGVLGRAQNPAAGGLTGANNSSSQLSRIVRVAPAPAQVKQAPQDSKKPAPSASDRVLQAPQSARVEPAQDPLISQETVEPGADMSLFNNLLLLAGALLVLVVVLLPRKKQ
ncbi:hypothetical protein ACN08Y_00640 [Rothia sp. P5764]|uniref:hypothetical protein n=1 Tax=Rothia sp. P5764 TaxID=3402654 RepID=UPI003ACC470C